MLSPLNQSSTELIHFLDSNSASTMKWTHYPLEFAGLGTTGEQKLLLPRIPRNCFEYSTRANKTEVVRAHCKFMEAAKGTIGADNSTVEDDASRDVSAVLLAFPIMHVDLDLLLVMSAWFRLLFEVDDEIERLSDDTAKLTLMSCIEVFRGSESHRRSLLEDTNVAFEGCRSIRLWIRCFLAHVDLLTHKAFCKELLKSISGVWEAMLEETTLKNIQKLDEVHYLDVRSRSIGVQPFFLILEHGIDSASKVLDQPIKHDLPVLQELKALIGVVVGLQNDIIGLERDHRLGVRFNHVLLTAENSTMEAVTSALTSSVRLHNETVLSISGCCAKLLLLGEVRETIGTVGRCLLGCIEPHVKWALASQRYKVATQAA